jgi:hypothetical protein
LLLLIHIFPYVLFSVPLGAFLVSFHLKTGFLLPLGHMLCISSPNTPTHSHTCLRAYGSLAFDWKRTLYLNHVYSILAHKHMHKHPVSASDFKMLWSGTSPSERDLLIRESLLISQLNPVLNANIRLSYFSGYVILTLTILTMHLALIFTN